MKDKSTMRIKIRLNRSNNINKSSKYNKKKTKYELKHLKRKKKVIHRL